jgi:Predicted ATPase (AAA+ superfamily)
MAKFYDRENELSALESIEANSNKAAGFTVVTGRRRIGKTALLRKFMENKRAVTFLPVAAARRFYANSGRKRLNPIWGSEFMEGLQASLSCLTR